jgi:hypothetical protein
VILNLLLPFRRIAHREDHKIERGLAIVKVSAVCRAPGSSHLLIVVCDSSPDFRRPSQAKDFAGYGRAKDKP